ncbi:type II toxin-antitoxin system VapC family toxin [uncultured Methylobacterium sp.]|uniref:type II toxin-antitoxin system VapC family toxin n=1 Tax=uncultured Methylobacterium sp. TaxID=157278 RepID=UPI0035C975C6
MDAKTGLGRPDFQVDPAVLKRGLVENGCVEMSITGDHAVAVIALPLHHKDPFDRMLIAQATVGGITLRTVDPILSLYAAPVRRV